jgi:glycosyltransferase involved in cell wall biosynthesis
VTNLVYIADARLPTEKAHGWQIAKMCEAFARAGIDVQLWHPWRRQYGDVPDNADVFSFYAIPRVFEERTLANVDVVAWEPKLPDPLARAAIVAHAIAWEWYATRRARVTQPDLCYTRDLFAAYWFSFSETPSVYEVHHIPSERQRKLLRRIAARRQPQVVVALTPAIRDAFLTSGFAEDRLVVDGDAVDLRPFEELPTPRAARRLLGLPEDRPLVGYVGRFHMFDKEKGLPELVEAMGYLPGLGLSRAELVCVGGPMDRVPGYLELAVRTGVDPARLRFVDRVPNSEVPLWLRAFDVATLPYPDSQHFAMALSPLKMFEYMAAGTPIVATDLPSAALELEHERSALFVRPGDPVAMAAGLARLLRDRKLASACAANARRLVVGRTWDARANRILREVGLDRISA